MAVETDTFVTWLVVVFIVTAVLCFLLVWVWYRSTLSNLFWKLAGDSQKVCDETEVFPEYRHYIPRSSCPGPPSYSKETAQALLEIDLNVTLANCDCLLPLPTPPGFRYQKRIEAPDPYNGVEHMFCYIFWGEPGEPALISFTGTHYASEWADNLRYSLVPAKALGKPPEGCSSLCPLKGKDGCSPIPEVHQGFYQIYLAVREQIWGWLEHHPKVGQLYISGHSLGGALSTLCAYDLIGVKPNLIHYSFASPRVGNRIFSRLYNTKVGGRGFRIYNTEDAIPDLPLAATPNFKDTSQPPYIYQHVGEGGVPFTKSLGSLSEDHIQAYVCCLPDRS